MAVSDSTVLEDASSQSSAPLDWPLLNALPSLLGEAPAQVETCRSLLRQAQDELQARFVEEEPVEGLVRARACFTDVLLRTLTRAFSASWRTILLMSRRRSSVSGGKGRRITAPAVLGVKPSSCLLYTSRCV